MLNSSQMPFKQLLDALLDEDTPLNARYFYRLSDIDKGELNMLAETWPQISLRRRRAVLEDLEVLGENDYLLSFEAIGRFAVNDGDPRVRMTAVRLLWEYEELDLVPLFLGMMENDEDPGVRGAAAQGLGRFVYLGEIDELPEETLHDLEERLLRAARGDEAELVRRRALESIGYSSREEVTPLIETAYASGNREWIATALFAMGRSANDQWEERVIDMFESPHPMIRMEAARAAGELELKEAAPGLIELLEDDNDEVRAAAIWSLSQIGGEGVRDALEEIEEAAEDDEEVDFIAAALDNLAFTEDLELFTLFDLAPVGDSLEEDEDQDLLELIEDDIDDEEDDLENDEDDIA